MGKATPKHKPKNRKNVPAFLNERLGLNETHRKILSAASNLSPKDNAWLYVYGHPDATNIPSVSDIAKYSSLDEKTVSNGLEEIKNLWKIPGSIPTNNGLISTDYSLIQTLANQHRLRFDENINDYRVKRVHLMTAELGLGTLYTRNNAFEGEKIFRQALNLDEELNSVIIQGGLMPAIMTMYGKIKAEAAALIGLNKKQVEANPEEYHELKSFIELAEMDISDPRRKELTHKQAHNLHKYIVNTLDTQLSAAESVPIEGAPIFKHIPEKVPIHYFYHYNDDYNLAELTDHHITRHRLVKQKAYEAVENLPQKKNDLAFERNKYATNVMFTGIANHIMEYYSDMPEIPTGKKLREDIKNNLFYEDNGKTARGLKSLKKTLKKRYFMATQNNDENEFELAFEHAKERYSNAEAITSLDVIKSRYNIDKDKIANSKRKIVELVDIIREYEVYQTSYATEEREKHGWFSKKVALSPTESKAIKMSVKEKYKGIYLKLFKELENIINEGVPARLRKDLTSHVFSEGKKPIGGFHPHTDREISIYIPDPGRIYEVNDYPDDKIYGTILTSIPRVNRQLSDEPVASLPILKAMHESSVSQRVKVKKKRPEKVSEFDKNHSMSVSDIVVTSHGTEGLHVVPRFVIAPTRIEGEYVETNPETVWYVKLPTRHDTKRLKELANKGSKGAKEIKRLFKGTPDTGNLIYIEHPDRSVETIAVNDLFYEQLADKYSPRITEIEEKLSKTKSRKMKQHWKNELEKTYASVREDAKLNNLLLANDEHLGVDNAKGNPTNVDIIRASQLAVLQSYGVENITAIIGTEFGNGDQKWRSYDNSFQGKYNDPVHAEIFSKMLQNKLPEVLSKAKGLKGDALNAEVARHLMEFFKQDNYARPTFRVDDQVEMFRTLQKPLIDDLMNINKEAHLGTGNHWTSSKYKSDEAVRIGQLFDKSYEWLGLLNIYPSHGQSFTFDQIKLPGMTEEAYVKGILTHKMWHGRMEMTALSKQAKGTRDDAVIYIVADRHHGGFAMEDKFFFMDIGKPPTNAYVQMIGKVSSVRGSMVAKYSPAENLIASAHFYLDNIVHKIIGWEDKSDVLSTCENVIRNEKKNYALELVGKKSA